MRASYSITVDGVRFYFTKRLGFVSAATAKTGASLAVPQYRVDEAKRKLRKRENKQ